ncbi:MAG TPA: DUF4230 domain-containing protein [Pseudacidobacterium sp.]|nr:DUF4230 domain-containing protein [Pseudacidobacterium sp.]
MRIHSILDPVEYEHRTSIPAILLTLLIGLVLGAAALVWFVRHPKNGFWNEMAARITGRSLALDSSLPTVVSKIQQLQRLETVVYTMDKVEEGSRESSYLPNFLAGDKLLLVVHGQTVAGIDLSQLKASDVQIDGRFVRVHLPQPEVFSTTIDNTKTRVYSRETGLLVGADPDLETEVRAKAQQDLQQAALDDGILEAAHKNAAATVTTMLLGLGFEQVQVQ